MLEGEHQKVDTSLEQFFAHSFSSDGSVVEPTGCDTAFYLSKLDAVEMSVQDKTELVHTLWRMMDSVIRMQFGFDSLTHIMNEKAQMRAQNDVSMIQSNSIHIDENDEDA